MAGRNRAPVCSKASFMDDLSREFLTETSESLDTVDNQLVRFEQEPNNAKILDNIFRLVHTIKGTCGFLGLPRLEALAHAAETLMGKFRDGMPVTGEAVTLILTTIDRAFAEPETEMPPAHEKAPAPKAAAPKLAAPVTKAEPAKVEAKSEAKADVKAETKKAARGSKANADGEVAESDKVANQSIRV